MENQNESQPISNTQESGEANPIAQAKPKRAYNLGKRAVDWQARAERAETALGVLQAQIRVSKRSRSYNPKAEGAVRKKTTIEASHLQDDDSPTTQDDVEIEVTDDKEEQSESGEEELEVASEEEKEEDVDVSQYDFQCDKCGTYAFIAKLDGKCPKCGDPI